LAASQELYLIDGRLDKELQDKSGVSDLKRGFPTSGEESAASIRIRSAGGSVRPQFRGDIVSDFLKDSYKYMIGLLKQFVPVKKAVRILGTLNIEWTDDFTKEEIQAEVDVDIDPISMTPENPDKEIQELTTILNLMTQALSNPNIFQKLQQEQKTFNLAPIIENMLMRLRIRDPEVFRNIQPEEGQGFVSVAELRAAQENINAAIQGQQPPSPPAVGQDHIARLELYNAVTQLLQSLGQTSDVLTQLVEVQTAIQAEEEQKSSPKAGSPVTPRVQGVPA